MKVEIIEYPTYSSATTAWLNSRPSLDNIDVDDVMSIDTQASDFPAVTLFITSTILEREIITSINNHIMWAQTSRINCDFTVRDDLYDRDKMFFNLIKEQISESMRLGRPQDDYRLLLPVLSNCSYTVKLTVRDLIKLTKHFVYLSESNSIFDIGCAILFDVLTKIGAIKYYDKFKHVDFNPPMSNFKNSTEIVGDFFTTSIIAPFSLRTHIARQRNIAMVDNLFDLIKYNTIKRMTIGHDCKIQISAPISVIKNLVSKRSCWMVHNNLWAGILKNMMDAIDTENLLPCASGYCPFKIDADERYADNDPGSPCPMHAILHDISVTKKHIEAIERTYVVDQKPVFWQNIIEVIK